MKIKYKNSAKTYSYYNYMLSMWFSTFHYLHALFVVIIFFNKDQTIVDVERKAKKTNIALLAVNSLNIYRDCARCAHDYARISIKNS